ncbi:hypothetical protein BWD42_02405 [Sphingobacterium sp. CZ-UAM]|uniref:hypothetical protein n=1 Tax=Sphingobacterium sp. CZ-UAM TaxID=1933868 RepID=UPI0009868DC9|nr:hypothetical protein [Sphingobacterium sp. CZ-UAM]OOG18832.1 hypothetical protein BWD42_02405 [Sphingobacterium sp. CZ-UAM]
MNNNYNFPASEELNRIIAKKSEQIGKTFNGPPYVAIQTIVRAIDILFTFHPEITNEDHFDMELIKFGWPQLLKPFYFNLKIDEISPLPSTTEKLRNWAISNLIHSGKIALCQQILSYEKADLISIKRQTDKHFIFECLHSNTGIERFDRESMDFLKHNIISRIIEDKKAALSFDVDRIAKEFKKLIKNPFGDYISYQTTPDIDDYYNEQGHYLLLKMQGYDNFDPNDKFGGIEYHKYITIIELIIGVAIKHSDACLYLKGKKPNVQLENLISYTQNKNNAINDYASYIGWDRHIVKQIFECITLTKENFDYYLEYPAPPPPMFIEVSGSLLIRSIAGCLGNPFALLNRELKRKFIKDFDKAVNNREDRFRKELFNFFSKESIIKIDREIKISFDDVKTDIDAIVYNKETNTLGLFQLKWQDPFSHSIKERFSRINNLFPKANEWLTKIKRWLSTFDDRTILNALQIENVLGEKRTIERVYLFVLARNQINFTGIEMDETAAWGSWYQLIEAYSTIHTTLNDPIEDMFVRLKASSPQERIKREKAPDLGDFCIDFGDLKLTN